MTRCCVSKCNETGTHIFPKDVKMQKQWLQAIRRPNFVISKSSRICRNHFKLSDYLKRSIYTGVPHVHKYLKNNAVPSQFSWNKNKTSEESRQIDQRLYEQIIINRVFAGASTSNNTAMPRPCPPKCSLKDCKSTKKTHTIYFFPKNEKLRKKWVKVISYSDPEFGKKEDGELLKLGVCNDHFMFDQYDDCGKKKPNAYPNKITQQEVEMGVPIVSYDSDSDPERKMIKRKKRSAQAPQEMDSDSNVKRNNPKRNKQSTLVLEKSEVKVEFEQICRLCLTTDVRMFSLNSEPLKQYYAFIKPSIDEWEMESSENFPTTVCYLCANSLRTCYQFGKLCAHSQSVLTEFCLVYSKINIQAIKEYDKSNSNLHRNLKKETLPSIFFDPRKKNQKQDELMKINNNVTLIKSSNVPSVRHNVAYESLNVASEWSNDSLESLNDPSESLNVPSESMNVASERLNVPSERLNVPSERLNVPSARLNEVKKVKKEIYCDISNDFGFGDLESPNYTHEVAIEEYLDEEILCQKEAGIEVLTDDKTDETNVTKCNPEDIPSRIPIPYPMRFEYVDDPTVFGSLSFGRDMETEQSKSRPTTTYKTKGNVTTKETDGIDILPPNSEQGNEPSTSASEKKASKRATTGVTKGATTGATKGATAGASTQSTEGNLQAGASDDVWFVDVTNVATEPVKETPTLSEATINTLKKTLSKSHGEVEVKRMYYEGDNINVIMVNSQGKQVLLKLSRTDNLQMAAADKPPLETPKKSPTNVEFYKKCWNVKFLSKEEQFILIRHRKNKIGYTNAPFKCITCYKSFQQLSSYNEHIKKHDPKSGNFSCLICKMYFKDQIKLLNHQITHTTVYACKTCPATFCSKIPAKEHQKMHIFYQCSACNQQFSYMIDFDKHVFKHAREMSNPSADQLKPIIKYEVDRIRVNKIRKKVTKGTIRSTDPLLIKKDKDRTIITENPKRSSVTLQPSDVPLYHEARPERQLPCPQCSKVFSSSIALKIHYKVHTNRPFKCPRCPKRYSAPNGLIDHQLKCGR